MIPCVCGRRALAWILAVFLVSREYEFAAKKVLHLLKNVSLYFCTCKRTCLDFGQLILSTLLIKPAFLMLRLMQVN